MNNEWKDDWTAEVVARCHHAGITMSDLARACDFAPAYLSQVLHKKKGNDRTRENILETLSRLESQRKDA